MQSTTVNNSHRQEAKNFLSNGFKLIRPEKVGQLSENRIALVHKNKKIMSIQERLMRVALLKKLEKIQNYDSGSNSKIFRQS